MKIWQRLLIIVLETWKYYLCGSKKHTVGLIILVIIMWKKHLDVLMMLLETCIKHIQHFFKHVKNIRLREFVNVFNILRLLRSILEP